MIKKLLLAPKRFLFKRLKLRILEGKIVAIEETKKPEGYKIATADIPEYPEIYYDPRVLKI